MESSGPRGPEEIMMRLLAMILCGLMLVGCGTMETGSEAAAKTDTPVDAQVNVPLALLDHAQIKKLVTSHAGKVVVVDVWSTSCIPCMKGFPNLVALHKKYGPDKVACVSVSIDYVGGGDDTPEKYRDKVQRFLNHQKAAFDNVLATEESDTMMAKFDIDSPPAILVYGRKGKLRQTFVELDEEGNEYDTPIYDRVGRLVAQLVSEK
jgi:thiol-disulfide isomerase/thioredoxin